VPDVGRADGGGPLLVEERSQMHSKSALNVAGGPSFVDFVIANDILKELVHGCGVCFLRDWNASRDHSFTEFQQIPCIGQLGASRAFAHFFAGARVLNPPDMSLPDLAFLKVPSSINKSHLAISFLVDVCCVCAVMAYEKLKHERYASHNFRFDRILDIFCLRCKA
jgi:hypothetical protein